MSWIDPHLIVIVRTDKRSDMKMQVQYES